MKSELILFLLYFSAIGSGLNAGLFFIFSNTVMTAFGKLKPHEGVAAMQYINRVIINPLFFLVFFGPALCSLAFIILFFGSKLGPYAQNYILLGSLMYLLGNILVTMLFNVPRNEALDKVDPNSKEASDLWARYLVEWTAWNHVRTIASTLAMLFFILSLN